jgi:hypothetical protein
MVAIMTGAIVACFASAGAAFERTAYILNDDTDSLVSVAIPAFPNPPAHGSPTTIASFGWWPTGSALLPDGRMLTLNADAYQLVAVTPENGELEVLCTMSQYAPMYYSDLFWGVDGRLRLYRSYGSLAAYVDLLDPETCELTPEAEISGDFESIENHQGQYYATSGGAFFRIDPQTYEGTLIVNNSWGPWLWGLASVGPNLWCGVWHSNGQGPGFSDITLIDPTTGDRELFVRIFDNSFFGMPYRALQVVEQPGPPSVPAVTPAGILVLVLGLGAAGLAVLRWR